MYLLDTNILSELVRKRPSPALLDRLRAAPQDRLHTSAVCVFELRYGAARRGDSSLWLRLSTELLGRFMVLPLGPPEAIRAGEVFADLEKRGESIGVEDVLIGATALVHNLAVVTANVRHLSRVSGLRVENWLAQ
mgnify:CR=1 FL=1